MDDELKQLREGMSEADRLEDDVARSFVSMHLTHYFAASEERRREVSQELQEAERTHHDILASDSVPGGSWRSKYPAAARAAVLAIWRTPKA